MTNPRTMFGCDTEIEYLSFKKNTRRLCVLELNIRHGVLEVNLNERSDYLWIFFLGMNVK